MDKQLYVALALIDIEERLEVIESQLCDEYADRLKAMIAEQWSMWTKRVNAMTQIDPAQLQADLREWRKWTARRKDGVSE
jgi:hypothetical protein